MRFAYLIALLIVELLFYIQTAWAASPVISEVMWPGSDLSSSDEWIEITLPVCSISDATCSNVALDLSAFAVHYLKSTGQEAVMVTFPSGLVIQPGQYLVISHFSADNSRLLTEPAVVNSAVTLLNSGLRLKLKNWAGTVIDEVDDGVGAPFAGANPSPPGAKASMERIDLKLAGTIKENWKTATTSRGLDPGANMLATPGYENSSSDSSVSSVSSASSVSSSSCSSDLVPAITLQSGNWTGIGKVTLNVQATATQGTMEGATCHFDFGDGYQSDSCNPGVHTYDHAGRFLLSLAVKNQCGNTLIQSKSVEVTASSTGTSSSALATVSPQPFDGSHLVISGVLPNPDSKDRDKEWIEIKNLEDRTVPLTGWHLAIGLKGARQTSINTVSQIQPHETIRLYQLESGIELTNAAGRVQLINPVGTVVSSVSWDKAEEGRVYKSSSFRETGLKGTILRVIDPVTFDISLEGPSALRVGEDSVRVRLLGIQAVDANYDLRYIQYQQKAFDFSRALVENKKIELLFDSEAWADDGILQAYIILDNGRILQKELLLAGLVIVDTFTLYSARQEYMDAQQKAIFAKAGFWSLDMISIASKDYRALIEDKKIDLTVENSYPQSTTNSGRIIITEVFAAPLASRSRLESEEESGSVLRSEWLEFFNPSSESLSLRGWTLSIGKKTITFGPSSIVEGGKYVIVLAHELGLKLRNDGDRIELKSPSKTYVVSLSYPRIKNGQSYIFDKRTESYCMSKSPSPGKRGSCQISAARLGSKTKVATAKHKRNVTKQRRSVYDKYAENYKQGLKNSDQSSIVIGLPETDSYSSGLLLIIGVLLGGLISFGLLQIPAFRRWVEIEPKRGTIK